MVNFFLVQIQNTASRCIWPKRTISAAVIFNSITYTKLLIEKPDHCIHTHTSVWRLSLPRAFSRTYTSRQMPEEKGMNRTRESINSVINTSKQASKQSKHNSTSLRWQKSSKQPNERTTKKTTSISFSLSIHNQSYAVWLRDLYVLNSVWFGRVAADVLSLARRFCVINEVQRKKENSPKLMIPLRINNYFCMIKIAKCSFICIESSRDMHFTER